jgi:hypothetical protein
MRREGYAASSRARKQVAEYGALHAQQAVGESRVPGGYDRALIRGRGRFFRFWSVGGWGGWLRSSGSKWGDGNWMMCMPKLMVLNAARALPGANATQQASMVAAKKHARCIRLMVSSALGLAHPVWTGPSSIGRASQGSGSSKFPRVPSVPGVHAIALADADPAT